MWRHGRGVVMPCRARRNVLAFGITSGVGLYVTTTSVALHNDLTAHLELYEAAGVDTQLQHTPAYLHRDI